MSKTTTNITTNYTDPLQQALDNLVAKGLAEIIGYRDGKPVYRATGKAMGTTERPARKSH